MTSQLLELTEDEFDAAFPLLRNHLNPHASWVFDDEPGCLFETFGDELAFVQQQDPSTVWTLIDGEAGDLYVVSGRHFVNRVGYLISTISVPKDVTYEVHLRSGPEESILVTAISQTLRDHVLTLLGDLTESESLGFETAQVELLRERLDDTIEVVDDIDNSTEPVEPLIVSRIVSRALADLFAELSIYSEPEFSNRQLDVIELRFRQLQEEFDSQLLITSTQAIKQERTLTMRSLSQFKVLLTTQRAIARVWMIDDVQTIRPDLNPDQCWEVLQHVDQHHDAELGINWVTLNEAAIALFGEATNHITEGA